MAIDRTRYRQLDFIGARILQARELNWIQEMDQGVAVSDNSTPVSGALQSQFRQGALYNVTVGITGLVVSLSATDGGKPMMIFVRDRWEIFPSNNDDCTDTIGTFPGNHTLTLSNVNTQIFLNWELKIRTGGLSGDDPSLTDATTNEAVASAGELILHLSNVDTSGVPLGGSQLAKNTAPIALLTFTNSGTLLTPVDATNDNVLAQAKASNKTSGFVKTTTSNPIAVSTDDSRMTDARPSSDGSVHDHSVRLPVAAGGTNSNGTPTYTVEAPSGAGTDIGGISAAKILLISTTQTLEAGWNWIVTAFNTLLNRFNAHETATLGLINTHPIPTAAQVGAVPLSHVGQALNLVTSHPAVVNQDSGGFRANRSGGGGAVDDPAYGVFVAGSPIVSLNHDGDVSSNKAAAFTASPGGILASGALLHMSLIAQVLSQHVNQTSHANPHGLTAGDIGAASVSYVDTGDANVLAAALAADATASAISLRTTTHRTGTTIAPDGAEGLIPNITHQVYMDYKIFRFGLHFEMAIGSGFVLDQQPVPLPEASGWSTAQCIVSVSPSWTKYHYDSDRTAVSVAYWTPNLVTVREHSNGHTPNYNNCWAGVSAIFFRFF